MTDFIEPFEEDIENIEVEESTETKELKIYSFKCKPCWEYQSIEFTFEGTEEDLPEMFRLYFKVLEGLKKDSPIQSNNGRPFPKDPATPAQCAIMDKYGIKYNKYTTKTQAGELIEKNKRKAERNDY